MENFFETKSERIPTKGEIMEQISRFAEGVTVTKELSDTKGLYLLQVTIEGKNTGEIIEYEYQRKGRFQNHNERTVTGIDVTYYDENGIPYTGSNLAEFNDATGEWKEIK